MASRIVWLLAGIAGAGAVGVLAYRQLHGAGAHPVPVDASVPPPIDASPPPPLPDVPPAAGIGVVARDDATSQPVALKLVATRERTPNVTAIIGADGQGAIALKPGRWTVAATATDGRPLAQRRGAVWEVGAHPPPWIELRLAPPADDPPAPPTGAAKLVGVATFEHARPADLVVTPIWLGEVGPGAAVARDRVPQPVALPPRRFVGTDGAWSIGGLPPGGYAVLVAVPWRGAALVRSTATAELAGDATATLERSVRLSGAVLDQRGAEVAGATVRVLLGGVELARVTADARGTFALHDVPPGELTVDARSSRCYGERKAETVAPGTDARFTLAMVCEGDPAPAAPAPASGQ